MALYQRGGRIDFQIGVGENRGKNNLVQNISWGPTCAMQQKSLRNVKKAG